MGRITYEPAINPIIELLNSNNDEDVFIRHAGSLALARIGKADPIVALSKHSSRAVRIAAVVSLRRLRHPGIINFLNDQDEFIVTEAARAINDDLSIEEALPALGDLLVTTTFKNEALIRRAINANLRVGGEKAMENLITYSLYESAPVNMRVESIDALSTWPKPSVVDRVDGRYRGVIKRDLAMVKSKSMDVLVQLLTHMELPLRLVAAKAIGKLKIDEASLQLFSGLKNDKEAKVRVEALRSLAAIGDKQIGEAIKQALDDKEKEVRIAGLDLLPKMNIPKELMVSLLSEVINTRTIEEKQAALVTLGNLPVENTQKVFDQLLNKMSGGKLPPEILLELSEAIDSTHASSLIVRYKEIVVKSSPDSLKAVYEGTLLGGDIDRGRRIFYRNQSAQCVRCHAYDDYGGNAGPRLNGVAGRLTREQILESLIDPSAQLASGFGTITLNLKNGKTISGILQREKTADLVLKAGNKPDTVIRKADVLKRTNAQSSMPPMHLLLTKREIRDLVSFLSTLKENN